MSFPSHNIASTNDILRLNASFHIYKVVVSGLSQFLYRSFYHIIPNPVDKYLPPTGMALFHTQVILHQSTLHTETTSFSPIVNCAIPFTNQLLVPCVYFF